jgi:hypothetical protein
MQFWAFVSDWGYRYGQEKPIITRTDPSGNVNPSIILHPTDNTMRVQVSYLPAQGDGQQTYEMFQCDVPHIPIQSWFAVSISMSQKNLDVYLNGQLVKSCFIPGVPINMVSNASVGSGGGFSGKVSDLYFHNTSLQPTDAMSFFEKGSSAPGAKANPLNPTKNYTYKLAVMDSSTQKEISSYSLF